MQQMLTWNFDTSLATFILNCVAGAPASASILASGSMPKRNNCQLSPCTATMVDSIPTLHAPPSNTAISSPKPALTCAAVVGLSCVSLLAEGAASAKPLSFKQLQCDWMVRHAQRNGWLTATYNRGNMRLGRQY